LKEILWDVQHAEGKPEDKSKYSKVYIGWKSRSRASLGYVS
jgi:hypothetical protein